MSNLERVIMIIVPKKFRNTLEELIIDCSGDDAVLLEEGITFIFNDEMYTLGFTDAGDLLELFDNVLITKG